MRIEAPLEFAAVPDRMADDLLYDPLACPGSRVALPTAPMTLGLLAAGDCQMVVVSPSERQTIDLVKDAGPRERFAAAEARLAGQRLAIGMLAGPALWHAERLGIKYERKRIPLAWDMPGPGAWRLAVQTDGRRYAEVFDQQSSWRLEGTRLALTEREEFSGRIELAMVYRYGGSPGTPPESLAPADLALRALGIEGFINSIDVDGLKGYRTASRPTTWADVFATLESIRYLYDNEVEAEERGFAGRLCDDVPACFEAMDARLAEFVEFTRQAKQAANELNPAHASALLRVIRPALDKLDDSCSRRARLMPAAEVARRTLSVKELTPKVLPDKKQQFSELWKSLMAAARERGSVVGSFRAAARELSFAAGMACADQAELRPAAARYRQLVHGVLRNRYYFERDWRGELQRDPPNWLGLPPY